MASKLSAHQRRTARCISVWLGCQIWVCRDRPGHVVYAVAYRKSFGTLIARVSGGAIY